jgi:hypothetical protein
MHIKHMLTDLSYNIKGWRFLIASGTRSTRRSGRREKPIGPLFPYSREKKEGPLSSC